MYQIRYIGDSVLRVKASPVVIFDENLKLFIRKMFEIMYKEDGIGLAANQIGVTQSILVLDPSPIEEGLSARAFINPKILGTEGEASRDEGCLSIPEVREMVTRPVKIRLFSQDEEGHEYEEEFEGWMARVLQHEIDHLNGVLFVDYLTPVKLHLLKNKGLIPEKY